jgi:hypothetical protein
MMDFDYPPPEKSKITIFTDEDLKRLKEAVSDWDSEDTCPLDQRHLQRLLARLEAAENIAKKPTHLDGCAEISEGYDLPRPCDCGMSELRSTWLERAGKL